ncbi:MAG TPA: CBS domain-containing protein [Pyrinomonadaceae bacterium]|nr:CBS domain-containing protein [Pyrinomonadaceae bacterium]
MICPSCGTENIEGADRCENCLAPFRDLDVPRADAAEGLARSVMEDTLSKLDQEATISVSPETPALDVARQMRTANQGCALVMDGPKLVGIFTEHDVLLKMTSELANASSRSQTPNTIEQLPVDDIPSSEVPFEEIRAEEAELNVPDPQVAPSRTSNSEIFVRELMSPNPETLHEDDSVASALNKMSMGRYRHIPIRKGDGTYTVASIKSVLKYIAREDW